MLLTKSSKFHIRSSSDLYRTYIPGLVSHPELQYNALFKVSNAVSKMMGRVADSQSRTNGVHIDMMPTVWLAIKAHLLQETNERVVILYHDNDNCVPTVKHGVFVTPGKRIQLSTIERETEEHHKFDRMSAYTRAHLAILQQVLGSTFGIEAHIRHPKAKSEQDKAARKLVNTKLATVAIGQHAATPPHHISVCHHLQTSVEKTSTDVTSNVSTSPVTHVIRTNTLVVIPTVSISSLTIINFFGHGCVSPCCRREASFSNSS
jgi:hypothetical protein